MKIDKNIPMPTESSRTKYPMKKLAVGDSFFVTTDRPAALRGSLHSSAKYHGIKVVVRSQEGGLRVWRAE
jgi:TusA-related sulfurtransferase